MPSLLTTPDKPTPETSGTRRDAERRWRVGLVGAGFIADYHVRALRSLPAAEPVAVCDRNAHRAGEFARQQNLARSTSSLDEMLAPGDLDVVHVLTPPDHHAAVARRCLERGVHVLVEKPLATTVAECDELLAVARDHGVRLGVSHNSPYFPVYERLRADVRTGRLGPLDRIAVSWHLELPQLTSGPFDLWMVTEPENIVLETGSHLLAWVFDLVDPPTSWVVRSSDPLDVPGGRRVWRRWQAVAQSGSTALDLMFAVGPGFTERRLHAHGLIGTATADVDCSTYTLDRHTRYALDLDRSFRVRRTARALGRQAAARLWNYALSKFSGAPTGNPYLLSIVRTTESFYAGLTGSEDMRVAGVRGREIVRACRDIAAAASLPAPRIHAASNLTGPRSTKPEILITGASGFIGRALVRLLAESGRALRAFTRGTKGLPDELNVPAVEVYAGRLESDTDLKRALTGVRYVLHLARAHVKSWEDYKTQDIAATERLAEACLAAGVTRLVYTGTIASLYTGARAGVITDDTPLDPQIHRRDNYSRAKALSEDLLLRMYRERGLPVVIARPGIVIGGGANVCHWGVGMWNGPGVVQLWGDGRNRLPFVLVDDVAAGLMACLYAPGIAGRCFNLVADPALSAREYIAGLERATGCAIQVFATSAWRYYVTDLAKWVVKLLVRDPTSRRPSYRDWETRTARAVFSSAGARSALGWSPTSDGRTMLVKAFGPAAVNGE